MTTKQYIRGAVAIVAATVGLGATAVASADPTNNPHAFSVPFVCGDGVGPVTLLINETPNGNAVAHTATTSVGIAVTGSPGNRNGVQTTTCTGMVSGQQVTVTAFFTPPTH